MGHNVSNWFLDQTKAIGSEPKRVFKIGTSDYSDRVSKWPSIKRTAQEIKAVNPRVNLANADGEFNQFFENTYLIPNTCTIEFGFTHPTSGDELITIYTGFLKTVSYPKKECITLLKDRLWEFTQKKVGESDTPVEFSNLLPSDIAWTLCTCYGELSTDSATNPDIDYDSFEEWASVFSHDGIFCDAYYDGQKITEALSRLSKMTDSAIWVEGDGKINFKRFSTPDVALELLTDPGLESWTGDTPDLPWYEVEDGGSTITKETSEVHGGSSSVKGTIDASGSGIGVWQSISYTTGQQYTFSVWLYGDGSSTLRILDNASALGGLDETVAPPASWTKYEYTFTANANSNVVRIIRANPSDVSWVCYMDDFSLKETIQETILTIDDEIIDLTIDIESQRLVNKQYVAFNYAPESNYWQSTLFHQDSTSVNTFGLNEELIEDDTIWFVSSASAMNLAQRMVALYKTPPKLFKVQTPLVGIARQLGDTIRLTDSFYNQTALEAWTITGYEFHMNKDQVNYELDGATTLLPFILDISTLDNMIEVLT